MRYRPTFVFIAMCVFLLTNTLPLRAQVDIETADVKSIRRVIEQQIDAFKRDDATGAYSFAAPPIRKIFPSAEIFMRMVRQGYQPVYRPRSFAFEELTRIDGKLVQPVRVIGPDGLPVTALYIMERQPDGSWKIGGCVLTQAPGQGA
jgi:ketosteroid isomerase-like protein